MKMRYFATLGLIAYIASVFYALGVDGYKGNFVASLVTLSLLPVINLGCKHQSVRFPNMQTDYIKYYRLSFGWLIVATLVHVCAALLPETSQSASVYATVPPILLLCLFMVIFSRDT